MSRSGPTGLEKQFTGLKGSQIPYGTYLFTIERLPKGSQVALERTIKIEKPTTFIAIQAPPPEPFSNFVADRKLPPDFVIRGRIEDIGRATQDNLWLRLIPIPSDEAILDVAIDNSGHFEVHQPLGRRYIAVLLDGGRILDMRELLTTALPKNSAGELIISLRKP